MVKIISVCLVSVDEKRNGAPLFLCQNAKNSSIMENQSSRSADPVQQTEVSTDIVIALAKSFVKKERPIYQDDISDEKILSCQIDQLNDFLSNLIPSRYLDHILELQKSVFYYVKHSSDAMHHKDDAEIALHNLMSLVYDISKYGNTIEAMSVFLYEINQSLMQIVKQQKDQIISEIASSN